MIDTINSGGFTHCFFSSNTEHLSGNTVGFRILLDINLDCYRFNLLSTKLNKN